MIATGKIVLHQRDWDFYDICAIAHSVGTPKLQGANWVFHVEYDLDVRFDEDEECAAWAEWNGGFHQDLMEGFDQETVDMIEDRLEWRFDFNDQERQERNDYERWRTLYSDAA